MKISTKDIEELLSQYQPEFIVDENDVSHVLINEGGTKTPIPVPSQQFIDYINDKFLEAGKEMPPESMLKSLMRVYAFRARRGGDRRPLPCKVTWADDNKSIIYDRNQNGDQIKITEHGCEKVNSYTVFRTGRGLPVKVAEEGNLDGLFDYINISDEDDRLLYLCTVVCMLVPDIPHCILGLSGMPGSGKTKATDRTKALIDPWMGEAAQMPQFLRTLGIAVHQQYVSGFDNISVLSSKQSDFLCRCTTGVSCLERENYTDSGLVLKALKRCFILNGVERCEKNVDLLQRSVIIEFDPISEEKRKCELEQNDFEKKLPVFRAAIFNLLSKAMDIYFNHRPYILPKRLADYTLWSYCIAESYHEGYGERFMKAYDRNIEEISNDVLSTKPLLSYLMGYLASIELTNPVQMRFDDFYNAVYEFCEEKCRGFQRSNMPSTSCSFSHYIKQYLPDIKRQGYILEYPNRCNHYQPIKITRITKASKPESDICTTSKPAVKAVSRPKSKSAVEADISVEPKLFIEADCDTEPKTLVDTKFDAEISTLVDDYDAVPPLIPMTWHGGVTV